MQERKPDPITDPIREAFLALCQSEFEKGSYEMTSEKNMAELAVQMQESGMRIAKAIMCSRLEDDPRRAGDKVVCRKCQGTLRIQERSQRRAVQTVLGEIEYVRAYGVCDRCGHSGAPLDEALGISAFGPSVDARKRICHAAVADGAVHIRELKNLQFPDAVFILDWAHAAQHLSDCSKALFGEGTNNAHAWYQIQKRRLWNGHVNVANGWPIGSGVAEGAVKQFALRLKGSEKFWNVSHTGAEEMLTLCALYHSGDGRWDRHWRKRAEPR